LGIDTEREQHQKEEDRPQRSQWKLIDSLCTDDESQAGSRGRLFIVEPSHIPYRQNKQSTK
jgi:hypothetical protein